MNLVPLQALANSVEAKEEDVLDASDEAVAAAAVVQEKQTITAPVSTHHVIRQRYEEKRQTHVVVERPKATPSFAISGVEGRLGGTCPDVSKQFTLPNFDRVNWKYGKRQLGDGGNLYIARSGNLVHGRIGPSMESLSGYMMYEVDHENSISRVTNVEMMECVKNTNVAQAGGHGKEERMHVGESRLNAGLRTTRYGYNCFAWFVERASSQVYVPGINEWMQGIFDSTQRREEEVGARATGVVFVPVPDPNWKLRK
ncbi:unnamed protein product [Linum trigynum]|uniref:Uncharacterized protein n=1 Tax=Linum trigynum TaxID=586398 RepID=A0AAV2GVW7_9ROSI